MTKPPILAALVIAATVFTASWTPAEAQFGKLKDKIKKDATKAAEGVLDTSKEEEANKPEAAQAPDSAAATTAEPQAPTADQGNATSEDMKLYTKYDFVPGDKVIFYDDYSTEEIGEFPSRWQLDDGVFEIAKQGAKNYIMCTDGGTIRPKIPPGPLPPKYTIELEFWSKGPGSQGHWYHIRWFDAENRVIAEFAMRDLNGTSLSILDKEIANKALPSPLPPGLHTMRVMATANTIKCYIDHERVANVPSMEGFDPVGFRIYTDPWEDQADNPMLIGTLRYAEGGKTLRQQLEETGRIVTHGILFDSGSVRIKAESYKTLADIGQLLTSDAALRLSIEGHTDSDGGDESNLKLSQDRAASVKTYLTETYKIDAGRLETKGWGEGKPIDTNDTAEGKANNRRVELVKL